MKAATLMAESSVFVFALSAILLALCVSVDAQPLAEIPRVGFLGATDASTNAARMQAFRQGLHDLGYVEGKNIVIEYRWAHGKAERLPDLVTELVRLKVDVIVTSGPAGNRTAKQATSTIPIVMTFDDDPVGNGLVASLARPGGNVTGLSTLAPELTGKRLELLKEIIPKLTRVAVLGTSSEPGNAQSLKETERAAAALGIQLQYLNAETPTDIENAFRAATKGHADAVIALASPLFNAQRKQIVELTAKSRLAVTSSRPETVEDGGLMTYGVKIDDLFRRAATYVDRILKGANPADLPVEQPKKFELIINLKAAKQIGLTVPPNVLARADRVIR